MDPTVKYSIERLKERKGALMRQKLQFGDFQAAQAALVGEMVLEELEREILAQEDMAARVRRDQEEKQRKREERKAARRAARESATHSRPISIEKGAA